jgi:hypothetical protein
LNENQIDYVTGNFGLFEFIDLYAIVYEIQGHAVVNEENPTKRSIIVRCLQPLVHDTDKCQNSRRARYGAKLVESIIISKAGLI